MILVSTKLYWIWKYVPSFVGICLYMLRGTLASLLRVNLILGLDSSEGNPDCKLKKNAAIPVTGREGT
jgi:hypothetical protein